jgi:hypothetical protein
LCGIRYDGSVGIGPVNGIAIDTPFEKSGLKQEDQVMLEYKGKIFVGIIDLESTAGEAHPIRQTNGRELRISKSCVSVRSSVSP